VQELQGLQAAYLQAVAVEEVIATPLVVELVELVAVEMALQVQQLQLLELLTQAVVEEAQASPAWVL
jgi:hypothetical protein